MEPEAPKDSTRREVLAGESAPELRRRLAGLVLAAALGGLIHGFLPLGALPVGADPEQI